MVSCLLIGNRITDQGMARLATAVLRNGRLAELRLDHPLPEDVVRHLARNADRHGIAAEADQAAIRSVYR